MTNLDYEGEESVSRTGKFVVYEKGEFIIYDRSCSVYKRVREPYNMSGHTIRTFLSTSGKKLTTIDYTNQMITLYDLSTESGIVLGVHDVSLRRYYEFQRVEKIELFVDSYPDSVECLELAAFVSIKKDGLVLLYHCWEDQYVLGTNKIYVNYHIFSLYDHVYFIAADDGRNIDIYRRKDMKRVLTVLSNTDIEGRLLWATASGYVVLTMYGYNYIFDSTLEYVTSIPVGGDIDYAIENTRKEIEDVSSERYIVEESYSSSTNRIRILDSYGRIVFERSGSNVLRNVNVTPAKDYNLPYVVLIERSAWDHVKFHKYCLKEQRVVDTFVVSTRYGVSFNGPRYVYIVEGEVFDTVKWELLSRPDRFARIEPLDDDFIIGFVADSDGYIRELHFYERYGEREFKTQLQSPIRTYNVKESREIDGYMVYVISVGSFKIVIFDTKSGVVGEFKEDTDIVTFNSIIRKYRIEADIEVKI